MDKQQTVGKVNIDLSLYDGVDMYSDGGVEDLLLELVKKNGDVDYSEIILQNYSWPILYHLSPIREAIIDWYPADPGDKVLEIGAGCGAVTGTLLKKGCDVTSLDLSYRRSLINAYRHRDHSNLHISVSNIQNFVKGNKQKFDIITLIGVFEYAASFIESQTPYDCMLKMIAPMLADNGVLIIAIENRLGLKYFAGCREDHLGALFRGIEGYDPDDKVRTFSRKELLDVCIGAGLKCSGFYYPYPDYKLPRCIYSDDRLPNVGELSDNQRNFDSDRLYLFDESKAFDGIISAGLFPEFSNSFLVCLKKA